MRMKLESGAWLDGRFCCLMVFDCVFFVHGLQSPWAITRCRRLLPTDDLLTQLCMHVCDVGAGGQKDTACLVAIQVLSASGECRVAQGLLG